MGRTAEAERRIGRARAFGYTFMSDRFFLVGSFWGCVTYVIVIVTRSGSVGDNVGGPVVIVPTFTVTINPMEDDEASVCHGISHGRTLWLVLSESYYAFVQGT